MIRKARVSDAAYMQRLVNQAAKTSAVLPRSLNSIYESLRDFCVHEEQGKVLGCCALHVSWEDLAEIRSLAVAEDSRGTGIGKGLVDFCLTEARGLGIRRVFLLTAEPDFFERMGFAVIDKAALPHKIWRDCLECVHFPDCCEVAMLRELKD